MEGLCPCGHEHTGSIVPVSLLAGDPTYCMMVSIQCVTGLIVRKTIFTSAEVSVFWQNFMCAGGMAVFVIVTFPPPRDVGTQTNPFNTPAL